MKHEQPRHDGVELAEIWRNAHHRRTQDVWCWIIRVFKKQRLFKSHLTEAGVRLGQILPALRNGPLASEKPGMTGGQSG
jgi:hypothetical protein